jgi:MFS family permease
MRQIKTFPRPAKWFLTAIIVDGIVYSGWILFFNFYMVERGFDRGFIGLVNSFASLAILVVGLPMGRLADKIGAKRSMVIGVAVSMVFMALEVTVRQPALILACSFVTGMAGSLFFLSQAPFMMKVSNDDNRTLLFSLNFGLVTLAGAVGSLFAGQLPALFGSLLKVEATSASAYQAVLLACILMSTFTLVPLLLIHEPKGVVVKEGETLRGPSLRSILSKPMTLKLALPNLLVGTGAALLIPYLNLFFSDKFHISDAFLGVLFSISALMTGVGSIAAPRLEGRLGSKIKAVVFTQAGSLAFLLLMGFSPYLGLVVVAYLMRGTLMNMAVPLYSAFAMEQTPENEQATVNSVKELAWQIGWLVGPTVSGIVQERYGFSPLFAATGVLYALSCVVTWALFNQRKLSLNAVTPVELKIEPAETAGD